MTMSGACMQLICDEFLRHFHGVHPGITTRAFARGITGAGGSSYDLLAGEVPAAATVLDLGCGDGYLLERLRARGFASGVLTGVDMSPEELALARRRKLLAGVALIEARAQCLPLGPGVVSCVISHLAFTLMSDVDQVVSEIARVLAPGGVFLAMVGGGPRLGDAFELFLDVIRDTRRDRPMGVPRLGDPRARSPAGLRALFGAQAGFDGEPEIRDVTLRLDGSFDEVWDSLSTIYELCFVREAERAVLRAELARRVMRLAAGDGRIPCSVAMSLVRCRRAGGSMYGAWRGSV
jgi:SAM-dependent methyltransferase